VTPTVGHWYLNVALPLSKTQRVRVVVVRSDTVVFAYLVEAGEHESLITWKRDAFCRFFRPCEDRRRAHTLGSCASTCPTCFHPRIERVVERIIRRADAARARRRERRRQQRMAAAKIPQQIPQLTPAAPVRKAR
jgi:hypothetical protein